MKSTVEELVAKINASGWWVSDMYQAADAPWRCSLRKTGDFTSAYGSGETMRNALLRAWQDAKPRLTDKEWQQYLVHVPTKAIERVEVKNRKITRKRNA